MLWTNGSGLNVYRVVISSSQEADQPRRDGQYEVQVCSPFPRVGFRKDVIVATTWRRYVRGQWVVHSWTNQFKQIK